MRKDDPSLPSRLLGSELRRIRKRAKYQAVDISRMTGIGSASISRLEKGARSLDTTQVAFILGLIKATPKEFSDAMTIAGLAASNICTLRHPARFPDQVGPLLALEEQAANATIFDPTGVPDLLQTESYIQATLSTLDTTDCDHESLLEARKLRQRRFSNLNGMQATFYLDERALRRHSNDASTMRDQLLHLAFMASTSQCRIRIIPADLPVPVTPGPVGIFEDPELPALAKVETPFATIFSQEESDTQHYGQEFKRLQNYALDPDESIVWMSTLADNLQPLTAD
ncbi:hypothetical protein SAMN04489733_1290 [Amycolatopsis keratiniphila]|nr:helix-turn-helix transcriptional regulator [Amycolatopsis keratiniphila]SDU11884.1 hypothetical protein SAMN04489733_1290 [Amycolatopsis keratiniphila]